MAINFLDNIQLNQNQLLGARLENVTSDPGSALGGDIIFNSTSNILKYYNGSAWISLTADTQGMVNFSVEGDDSTSQTIINGGNILFQGGTGIATSTASGSTLEKKVTIVNSLPFNGLTLASTTGSNSTIANSGTITLAAGAGITTTNNSSGTVTIAATGSGSMSSFTLSGDGGTDQTIEDGDTLNIAGGTNITTAVGATDKVTVNLDASPTLAGQLTVSGTGQSSFAGQVTIPTTPAATTDAASKSYVDNSVVGNLIFQGGYNAATNTPDLDSSPSSSIKKGWSYVVTAAGSFFTETVEVGDFIIAQQDAPTTLANWVTVQNNIDLATASNVGIGNVNVDGAGNLDGLSLSYASGTATVGVDIANNVSTSTAVGEMLFLVYDGGNTGNNLALPIEAVTAYVNTATSFAGTSASGTSHVFTHSLNSSDVIVQVYDASTLETVYASVERNSVNQVTVTTAASANIRCLIQKIG